MLENSSTCSTFEDAAEGAYANRNSLGTMKANMSMKNLAKGLLRWAGVHVYGRRMTPTGNALGITPLVRG